MTRRTEFAPPATPGAVLTASGVVVTVAAPAATEVVVEWQQGPGAPVQRTALAREGAWWSGELRGARAGTRYGLRADGPWDPAVGLRFNPAKLLLDPMAHAVDGPVRWHPDLRIASGGARHPADSGPRLPRAVVVDDQFDWSGDRRPEVPWERTVIYEAHVKGLTMQHPELPAELRGRYAGLAHPAVTGWLRDLGVTAVQLLPVQQAGDDRAQVRRRIGNYWGYAPVLFAGPDQRFASAPDGRAVREFQTMVQALHAAGLEVLLDVVFNHTLEGDADGATLHLRGLMDAQAYRRRADAPDRYLDDTGCGHTLHCADPLIIELVRQSLRWWCEVCRVDGFRFDLGATLARGPAEDPWSAPLLDALLNDPVVGARKLIVEPWDLGADGYRLGRFRAPIVEWNDTARHAIRRFWRGGGSLGEFARRVKGSDDVFAARGPLAGVTYVACHDGFALADLVRYRRPRTESNGERGQDAPFAGEGGLRGDADPADGPSADLAREVARIEAAEGMLATTLLAMGVPMLAQGDERLQGRLGNANPYCHDSPLVWRDWQQTPVARRTEALVRDLLRLRHRHPALRSPRFWPTTGADALHWWTAAATPMMAADWDGEGATLVAELLHPPERWLVVWHAGAESATVTWPAGGWTIEWASRAVARADAHGAELAPRSVLLLRGHARA